jgi:hypothetical protein
MNGMAARRLGAGSKGEQRKGERCERAGHRYTAFRPVMRRFLSMA